MRNSGTISGVGGFSFGIWTDAGHLGVVNTATGTITGGGLGSAILGGADVSDMSVVNAGTISGSANYAIRYDGGGNFNLTNTGSISMGVAGGPSVVAVGNAVINNGSGGSITGSSGGTAIGIGGTGTIINAGTISAGISIEFNSGSGHDYRPYPF